MPRTSPRLRRPLSWLMLVVLAFPANQASASNQFEPGDDSYNPESHLQFLEDVEGRYVPETALRMFQDKTSTTSAPPSEFAPDIKSVWTLFTLKNASPDHDLMLHQIWLTDARAFRVDGKKLIPLEQLPFRYPIFRLPVPPGESVTVLMETQQRLGSIKLHIRISNFHDFWKSAHQENVIFAVTMYVMAVLGLIGIILSLAFRQKFYFFNACYILLFDLFLLIMHGLVTVSYFPLVVALVPLIALTLSRFNVHFFDLDGKSRLVLIQNSIVTASTALFIFWWCTNRGLALTYLMTTLQILVSIYLAQSAARQGDMPSRVLLLAWSMLVLSALVGMYHVFIHPSDLSSWVCLFSYLGEAILFNIALAIKVRLNERTANQLNNHTFAQLSKVFHPHQIELMRQGQPLEATMPIGEGRACVICFDVIGSSTIAHPDVRAFLLNVIKRCQESMQVGYDGKTLRASAFRIKEMGDGFLCSVGYPFKSLQDNIADAAFELSHKFYNIFLEEVARLGYHRPIGCSMAIAYGSLSSFFPQAGTREYDFYGKAIILATRYEHMRRVIFPNLKGSVLIIDERTLRLLSPRFKAAFSAFDMKAEKLMVRDDPFVRLLYYQLLAGASQTEPVTKVSARV